MAKKGKPLSAATRQKISESVKRAQAAAKSRTVANIDAVTSTPYTTRIPVTPRSSKDEAVQLAVDAVSLVVNELSPAALVRLVDRILRP